MTSHKWIYLKSCFDRWPSNLLKVSNWCPRRCAKNGNAARRRRRFWDTVDFRQGLGGGRVNLGRHWEASQKYPQVNPGTAYSLINSKHYVSRFFVLWHCQSNRNILPSMLFNFSFYTASFGSWINIYTVCCQLAISLCRFHVRAFLPAVWRVCVWGGGGANYSALSTGIKMP